MQDVPEISATDWRVRAVAQNSLYKRGWKRFRNELEPFRGVPSSSNVAELQLTEVTDAGDTFEGNQS